MDYAKWMNVDHGYGWHLCQLHTGEHFLSDGRVALISPDAHKPNGAWKSGDVKIATAAEEVAACRTGFAETTVGALRDFAGPKPVASLVPCDECGGSGKSECYACGHEDDCDGCDGSGKATEYDRSECEDGWLFGMLVDRVLLATYLPDAPAEQMVASYSGEIGTSDFRLLIGDGWKLVIAGFHQDKRRGKVNLKSAPRLESTAEAK